MNKTLERADILRLGLVYYFRINDIEGADVRKYLKENNSRLEEILADDYNLVMDKLSYLFPTDEKWDLKK